MPIPANLFAQTAIAAYFVAMFLFLTLPIGILLFVAAAVVHARGARARDAFGVSRSTMIRAGVAAVLGSASMLVLAGYHGSYWFEHHQQSPGEWFTYVLLALLVGQIGLMAWLVRCAERRRVMALWTAVWLWIQLILTFVAFGGPVLGAL